LDIFGFFFVLVIRSCVIWPICGLKLRDLANLWSYKLIMTL